MIILQRAYDNNNVKERAFIKAVKAVSPRDLKKKKRNSKKIIELKEKKKSPIT